MKLLCIILLAALPHLVAARTITFANGDNFTVVLRVTYEDSFVDYVAPPASTSNFAATDGPISMKLVNFDTGSDMTGSFAGLSGDFVLADYNTLVVRPVNDGISDDHLQVFTDAFWFAVGTGFFCIMVWLARSLRSQQPLA